MTRSLLFTFLVLCINPAFAEDAHALSVASYQLKSTSGYQQKRRLSGQVIKQQEAQLAFEFPGKVIEIHRDQGEFVTKGDVIAKQDTQLLRVQKDQLIASKQKALAQLKLAKIEYTRVQKLDKSHYAAQQQLDQVDTNIAIINAEIAALNANIKGVELKIEKAALVAPFTGFLGQRIIALGEIVNSGTPVIKLIERQNNQISIGIPLNLRNDIKELMPVYIANQRYFVKPISKGAKIDSITRTLTMRFALADDAPVYSGQIAQLEIDSFRSVKGFWVPLEAISDGIRGTWQVYKITAQQLDPVTVNVIYSDGKYAYINGDLNNDDLIVANGIHKVSAHIAVNIVKQITPKAL